MFSPISHYISETIEDRHIVTMKTKEAAYGRSMTLNDRNAPLYSFFTGSLCRRERR